MKHGARKRDENLMKDRKVHGESNVWSTVQRQKRSMDFVVHVGLD